MTDTEQICNEAKEGFTILTFDQQLYTVMVDITWSNPTRWQFIIPHVGGVQQIMNFVGCLGKLMEGSNSSKLMARSLAHLKELKKC